MVGGYEVYQFGSVLQYINADEFPRLVALDEDEGLVINFLRPFDVPPELHVRASTACCVKAAVAPGYGARIAAN